MVTSPPASRRARSSLAALLVIGTSPVWGALLVRKFALESFHIPSGAMSPTLQVGDDVLSQKWASARAPTRGAVRVFVHPREPSKDYVSRVVGLAGDRVRVLDDGSIERNGVALRRCPLGAWPSSDDATPRDAFMEADGLLRYAVLQHHDRTQLEPVADHCVAEACEIPAGYALTVSDNRDDSSDGRSWGFVPVDNFTAAPRWIMRAAVGSPPGRAWHDPQGAPVLPHTLRSTWARCLAQLR